MSDEPISTQSGLGRVYQDGEVIVRQGDEGTAMYVVEAGRVAVYVESVGDRRFVRHLDPGEFFGEMSLFDRQVRSATVVASGEARVLTLDKRTLLRRFHEDPSLAYRVVETLSNRVRQLTEEVSALRAHGDRE